MLKKQYGLDPDPEQKKSAPAPAKKTSAPTGSGSATLLTCQKQFGEKIKK